MSAYTHHFKFQATATAAGRGEFGNPGVWNTHTQTQTQTQITWNMRPQRANTNFLKDFSSQLPLAARESLSQNERLQTPRDLKQNRPSPRTWPWPEHADSLNPRASSCPRGGNQTPVRAHFGKKRKKPFPATERDIPRPSRTTPRSDHTAHDASAQTQSHLAAARGTAPLSKPSCVTWPLGGLVGLSDVSFFMLRRQRMAGIC